jgi:glycerophosphoryl diester phosphodiesterase
MHPYFDLPTPHLFGHRGASGEAPENTRIAFELAWRQGVPYLEMDCHATRDGEIVILHDATIDRTTEESGPVRDRSFAELERLDAGYRFSPAGEGGFPYRGQGIRIPRLASVLEWFPEARINLEVKAPGTDVADAVVQIVRQAGAEQRMLLAAEEDETLEHLRKLDPGTAIGSARGDVIAFFQAVRDGAIDRHEPNGQALQIPPTFMGEDLVTAEAIEAAHRLGLRLHVWTINDADEMTRLFARGVDGLMSDYPARLVRVARERRASG